LSSEKTTGFWIAATLIGIGNTAMKTVQLALGNTEFAQLLRNLLARDGMHRVYMVDHPDLRLDGIIVIDGNRFENLAMLDSEPERFVVITRKASDYLSRIWDAGVRHVLFEGDSPSTAQLGIIAAELRLPATRGSKAAPEPVRHHNYSTPGLPVLSSPIRCGRCRFPRGQWSKF
jgi:hypothetical protein